MTLDEARAERLLGLAHSSMSFELTAADQHVLRASATGLVVDARQGDPEADTPENSDSWGRDRHVHAELVRWMCVDPAAKELIQPTGIRAKGLRVDGVLDLGFADVPFALDMEGCHLPQGINLTCADLRLLVMDGSSTGEISADGLTVKDNIFLRSGFKATGTVHLARARVGGDLDLTAATLLCPGGYAFIAEGAHIEGCVFLKKAVANGNVTLRNASIEQVVDCEGARFSSGGRYALSLNRAKVGSSLSLHKVWAEGVVELAGARVGVDVFCRDSHLYNRDAVALSAERAQIGGSLVLDGDFVARGEVRLIEARILADLVCRGGVFANPGGDALTADAVVVGGQVVCDAGFRSCGCVRLLRANISHDVVCKNGTLVNEGQIALYADGLHVGGSVFLDDGFRAKGEVRLLQARVDGNLQCSGGRFENAGGKALSAHSAQVGRTLMLDSGMQVRGKVSLIHARTHVLKDAEDSWPDRGALELDGFVYDGIRGPMDVRSRLAWLERQYGPQPAKDGSSYSPQPYEQLASVFRRTGRATEARRALIAKEVARRRYAGLAWWRKLIHRAYGCSVAFGYRPEQAFYLFAPCIVILMWLVFAIADSDGAMKPVVPPNAETVSGKFHPLVYAVDSFLPVVNLHEEERWLPDPDVGFVPIWCEYGIRTGLLAQLCLLVNIACGWFLTFCLVAGLSGIVRREA